MIMCTFTYFINIWEQTARWQLDFQFLAQDFQIEEGGSQEFLIQNVSGSTVGQCQVLQQAGGNPACLATETS